ncbi:MAG: aconitate hydratase AcnA [Bdellovibrionales bacterium]|nr:aconitate hydratase AcnA [Bdellovibrionales bacterium]
MSGSAVKSDFNVKRELKTDKAGTVSYASLPALEEAGLGPLSRLPYSIRILLESVLRNNDGFGFTDDHVRALAAWQPSVGERQETPYKPARVVLQDFTGVPSVVDLAAMRDSMNRLGGDPSKINPLVRCDLVIDHSVQVDYFNRADALLLNEKIEFHRNKERYEFLKWGATAFENLRVVPPSTGIVHQVNLEYLSEGIYFDRKNKVVYPDSCVGTDSHTPMVNGLGVVAWGVGGIEAEAVMLGQPIYMLVPDVIGIKLSGAMPEGATATDLVLRITEICREIGVVGKFVEFFGDGLDHMSVSDRATIGNMAPEQGSTVSFFPTDDVTLEYLRLTGRPEELIELTEKYLKAQGLFRTPNSPDPEYTKVVELNLSSIEPAVAGPKRPHDRVALRDLGPTYSKTLTAPVGPKGLGLSASDLSRSGTYKHNGTSAEMNHGAVVIAAITSCTNTSNPSVMLGAGLVAKKAVERGLKVKPYVKTSLAPGSRVVTAYLEKSGLLPYLEQLGFYVVGYGCTTCIGNSGPLPEEVSSVVTGSDLVVSAVLSGNRNFEGRVHPLTRTNYLASPPLVVAFAIAGSTAMDITKDPIGVGSDGKEVFLKDIWPTTAEVREAVASTVSREMFQEKYAEVFKGSDAWRSIKASGGQLYQWSDDSTYIQEPPFFDDLTLESTTVQPISGARVLGVFGDSVTTDHISPAGSIASKSPAAEYLRSNGVKDEDFNSYGSRRGNDRVMARGTFANIRIKNQLVPGVEGNATLHLPSGQQMSFFDAAQKYREENTPLIILAGKDYGSGSSRDWAAKGPYLLGVRAVIAESYERIHRSNLVGMGILPLQFKQGQNASSLVLDGTETFSFAIDDNLKPGQEVAVSAKKSDGTTIDFTAVCRIDTPVEIQYYRDGGILCTVIKNMAAG